MALVINDTTPTVTYTATSGQTAFTVPFEFFDNGDLVVTNEGVTLTYAASPADETEYSVTGAGVEGGGSITLGGAGATLNDTVVIYRDIPIERTADYQETGPFRVAALNTEQAKQTAMMQQLEAAIARACLVDIGKLPSGEVAEGQVLGLVNGSFVGVDNDATGAAASAAAAAQSVIDAAAQVVLATTAKTDAETAQTAAETAQTNAETAETNAETAETNAETAEAAAVVASLASGNVYHDTTIAAAITAAEAALTTGDEFFAFGDDADYIAIHEMDTASTSVEFGQLSLGGSSSAAGAEEAALNAYLHDLNATPNRGAPCPVFLGTGQSLWASRGTALTDSPVPTGAYMPVGGESIQDMDCAAVNAQFAPDYNDMASFVQHAAGGSTQSALGGVLAGLMNHFERAYGYTSAVGSSGANVILCRGVSSSSAYYIQKACEDAVANDYRPIGMLGIAHGEWDGGNGTAIATYTNLMEIFIGRLRLLYAQCMGEPHYVTPTVWRKPTFMQTSGERDIAEAIADIELRQVNLVCRSQYYVPLESDRTHPTEAGYIQNGYADAKRLLAMHFEDDKRIGPRVLRATWPNSGSTAYVFFSEELEDFYDVAGPDFGTGTTNLSSTGAWKGLEWFDNGTKININSAVLHGSMAVLTLNSTPTGTVAQQELRAAIIEHPATTTTGSSNVAGSTLARKNEDSTNQYNYASAQAGQDREYLTSGKVTADQY
jgi:hypothetical protein